MPILAYVLALLITVVLASFLTPARWWRRPTARAAAILLAGTWSIGSALLYLHSTPAQAPALAQGAAVSDAPPVPQQRFRVFEDLNLRVASSTSARRVAVVPAGAYVTATGARDGDWWELSASADGQPVRGWASSLWLRRPGERRR